MAETPSTPRFKLPEINDHEGGWGPAIDLLPTQFKDIPYAPFSTSDKLGRVADWTQPETRDDVRGNRSRANRFYNPPQTYGSGVSSTFVYQPEEDESSFSLVNRTPAPKRASGPGARGRGARGGRGGFQRLGASATGRGGASTGRGAHGGGRGGRGGGGAGWRDYGRQQRIRGPSIKVGVEWGVLEEIEFGRLHKLAFEVEDGEDIATYGRLLPYDRSLDRVSTKLERPLARTERQHVNVTASEDPVLLSLAAEGRGQVFTTDSVLAVLMTANRSLYPWDILITRKDGKLFLDKRDGGVFDVVHVNENAPEAPAEGEGINSVGSLAAEATTVNEYLLSQVTAPPSDTLPALELEHPSPFEGESDIGYRYRAFDLSKGREDEPDCTLVLRTEVDAYTRTASGQSAYVIVKALNEFDSKAAGSSAAATLDWRSKLESQRGAVLATEIKYNAVKMARWAMQGVLSGADQLKFGYVSRSLPSDSSRHTLLGMQNFKPADLAAQMNLSVPNGWGIAKTIIDLCLNLKDGKYILVKDPNKQVIRLYDVPEADFDLVTQQEVGPMDSGNANN